MVPRPFMIIGVNYRFCLVSQFFYFSYEDGCSKLAGMKKLVLVVFVGCCLWLPTLCAQTLPDEFPGARSLYAKAVREMREGNYALAIATYNELVSGYKNSQYRDIYHYGLARAYYHAGEFDQALNVLASFHTLFPNSYLAPYAYHLRANSAYRTTRLESAFHDYIQAYEDAEDRRLRELSRHSILAMIDAGYVAPDSALATLPADLICPVKTRIAYLMKGRWTAGKIETFLAGCPSLPTDEKPPPQRDKSRALIGVLLPITGPYGRYGQAVLDGATLAAEHLEEDGFPVELLVYDTRADNVTAAREALLLAEAEVDLIIGPLLSSVAATAAAALSCSAVPLLVPAATQAGFSTLSPGCFQMSANVETIGRGMAQYAVRHRGMTTVAVICPAAVDEMTMADAFASEAERLGAHVLAVERFRSGETDFGPYINDIKEAILGPPQDSIFYITLEGDTLEENEAPVSFDGLFIPATEDQLFLILPQINFYRVTTSFLGTGEWNTTKVLKLGDKVLKDAVFHSDRAGMQHSAEYDDFAAAYDIRYGAEPDRLAAAGYDAVNILADAFRPGKRDRKEFVDYLASLERFDGASGPMTFGRDRTNLELPLFTLRDGLVQPLAERPTVEESSEEAPPDPLDVEVIETGP